MRIQTAGEQKYYDFIQERAKRLQTGMIVWGSLLAVAFICLFSNIVITVILAVGGAFLAMTNIKARSELKGKLDQIEDKEEFFRQLIIQLNRMPRKRGKYKPAVFRRRKRKHHGIHL